MAKSNSNNKKVKTTDSRKTTSVGSQFNKDKKEHGHPGSFGGHFGNKATMLEDKQDRRTLPRLFVDLQGTPDIGKVIELCGANFEAVERKMVSDGDDKFSGIAFPEHKGIIHSVTKKPLGIVGEGYVSVQPEESMLSFDAALKEAGAKYVAGGFINHGSRIFLIADLDKPYLVRKVNGKEDTIQSRAVLTTAFDGSGSYQIYDSPFRYSCFNALPGILIRKNNRISFPHTARIKDNIKNLITGMGRINEAYTIFCEQMKQLQRHRMDSDAVEAFLDKVFGEIDDPETVTGAALSAVTRQTAVRKDITERINHGMGNIGDTMFDAYNGVTEWIDHARGKDENRNESWMFGSGRRLSQKALEVALEMSK